MGVCIIVAAGVLLSLGGGRPGLQGGILATGACVCWGLDNNFTALIDGLRPVEITFVKGLVAGSTNLVLGCVLAPMQGPPALFFSGLGVGAISYGASLVLYVTAAQQLGATRSQAAFATAPFAGALLSLVLLHESFGPAQALAGALLGVGVALSLTDRHEHAHEHEAEEHVHAHRHDDGHHDHEHPGLPRGTRHVHTHRHEPIAHAHPHVSDLHHRHPH
jgi:drug/metabolite transporter (DMT)-like permease